MTPYELVTSAYSLPFPLYPFQVDAVNELADYTGEKLLLDAGAGKTISLITIALYKLLKGRVDACVVLMPPILLTNWSRTLSSIPGVTHTVYRGTPKQRVALPLDRQFIIMSYQIFCRDHEHLSAKIKGRTLLACDESTAVKNVGTATYKTVRNWSHDSDISLLSGTPLSSPGDAYAPIKLTTPSVYQNLAQFERIHIKTRDFFNNPTEWQNLDLLQENLMIQAVRVLKTDVLKQLPPVIYAPLYYDLDPDHLKTYRTLCDEQMLKFSDGTKIDATSSSALFHALQQIPMNREVFTTQGGKVSAGVELIEELLEELGDGKLVVFTSYRATNRMLSEWLKPYGVTAIYGEVSAKQQDEALETFLTDPKCRVILLQVRSAGFGLDRLQHVCSDVLFAEMPLVPSWFHQAVARLWRIGQTRPVTVRVAIAEKTIQVRLWDVLQDKDSLINMCVRGYQDIRDALAGEPSTVVQTAISV